MIDIGNRIKQLRMKNNLTLQELASRTELTKGFLSQLERNLTAPSLVTLEDLCEALGTDLSHFFKEEGEGKVVFTHEDAFVDEQANSTIHWVIPNAQKNEMEPILLELASNSVSKTIEPHEGQEFGYVLAGRIEIVIGKDVKGHSARKGDAFYLDGTQSHYLRNPSKQKAVILWVSTPPIF